MKGKKQSWIDEIPEDWEVMKLGELKRELVMGQAPPGSSYNSEGKGIPFVKATEFGKIYPRIEVWTTNPLKEVDGSFILISIAGTIGLINKGIKCAIGRSVAGIKPDLSKIDFNYLFYYLQFISPFLIGRGSSQKIIIAEDILKIKIIKPKSLSEQKAIAQILSTVDEAIQKVDEIITKTERLKKGLMQRLLTKGIGHKEFKDTEIGRIPKEWEVKEIKDLFIVETGTTPSTKQKEYWKSGSINWITPTDLSKLDGRIYIQSSERKITKKALKETNLTLLPKGSLVISTRAPVGYIAVLKESATFNQGCKGLVPKDFEKIVSEFYCYYLLTKQLLLQNLSGGSTFKELSKDNLEKIKVPFTKSEEQQKIAEILLTIDKKLELERKRKEKLERIKKSLMNDLLTGRKRVVR
ncbi:MAG: restriction endonuclease subunit S [Candidatus Aenigmatarchaeota archaeon]